MMHPSLARRRNYQGPAIFSYGFRPFFMLAGVFAALAIPLWLLIYLKGDSMPSGAYGLSWHSHEMLFGYLGAVLTGFLLTAIPNWTGRLPINGLGLMGLTLLWFTGRISFWVLPMGSIWIGLIDGAFLIVVALVIWREIIAGKNWRNLPVAGIVSVFAAANLAFHFEAALNLPAGFGQSLALGIIIIMITFIGGRIVPSFTRNWLKSQNIKILPAEFSSFDKIVIGVTVFSVVLWVGWPGEGYTGWAMIGAGLLVLIRLLRWQGFRALSQSMIWAMHLGYMWVGASLLLIGSAMLWPDVVSPGMGLHALTVGGIGGMTLAVMIRATLGHTGRARTSDALTTVLFVLINLAALARIVAPLYPAHYNAALVVSGTLWTVSFLLFVYRYGPMMGKAK